MHASVGRKVRDKITGVTGVVTGRVEYITGCNQLLVQPPARSGTPTESMWLDEQRAVFIGKSRIVLDNAASPGFDRPAPRI